MYERFVSLSARRVWIEIADSCSSASVLWSLSARRVWIEIPSSFIRIGLMAVTLREEGVD